MFYHDLFPFHNWKSSAQSENIFGIDYCYIKTLGFKTQESFKLILKGGLFAGLPQIPQDRSKSRGILWGLENCRHPRHLLLTLSEATGLSCVCEISASLYLSAPISSGPQVSSDYVLLHCYYTFTQSSWPPNLSSTLQLCKCSTSTN